MAQSARVPRPPKSVHRHLAPLVARFGSLAEVARQLDLPLRTVQTWHYGENVPDGASRLAIRLACLWFGLDVPEEFRRSDGLVEIEAGPQEETSIPQALRKLGASIVARAFGVPLATVLAWSDPAALDGTTKFALRELLRQHGVTLKI